MDRTIDDIVRDVRAELAPAFEERLRAELHDRDREWLVDQLVRLTLDAPAVRRADRQAAAAAKAREREARLERVAALALDPARLRAFAEAHAGVTREGLIAAGHLAADAPAKGTAALGPGDRSQSGEALLTHAKDVLFALLFGEAEDGTRLERTQQELLTMAVPRFKAGALDFMQASTEISGTGTWQDPESVSNDERADNVLLEVQFGEIAEELVGHGIVTALSLINNLEVNEQVLYARMINLEEATLIC
jgi:hypothetical protein